ncbi:MAG: carboxymuconolactone decarboxylase family protein [Methylotenera sp.]|nr:carboxymuconolactone decarboxylase family protein [Oligoflexia bacterium]
MSKSYYQPEDLKKFPQITEFSEKLGNKFFDYYSEVFAEGALTAREKSLIALAVAHAVQCAYCIDAYTTDTLEKGCNEQQMMEAVHVAAAIRGGSTLVHSVQMMNKAKEISM